MSKQEPNIYRNLIKDNDLISFNVSIKETDLYIKADSNLQSIAFEAAMKYRMSLEQYIFKHPVFQTTLEPLSVEETAPKIVKDMAEAGTIAGTGPMAAVAGAIAEYVGRDLLSQSGEVIVENRGDIFLSTTKRRYVGIYSGFPSLDIALMIEPEDTPLGVCTSSGTFGYSLSLGKSDAVTVLCPSTSLADAAATAIGNIIKTKADIPRSIEFIRRIHGIKGMVIIVDGNITQWGRVNLVRVKPE